MKIPGSMALAGLVWLAATFSGTWALLVYANAPGEAVLAPEAWPETSEIARAPGRPTLVMFVHPRCPCSRASVGELALLLERSAGRAEARVVFLDPAGMDADWVKTDLWRAAAAIPGVAPVCDAGGREARIFHAATSGQTLLYDAAGRLLFHGGITVARGHAGDNPGRSALAALLAAAPASRTATPVFGCSLFGGIPGGKTWRR
jgi:hypothetical protein